MGSLILGSGSTLYRSDAVSNAALGDEGEVRPRVRGKMHTAGTPAGERVFRRIFITVIHQGGCAFFAMPIVDGVPLPQFRAFFSRPAPPAGIEERHIFMLPMSKRGSVIEIEVEASSPTAQWHIETATFAMNRRNEARGRQAGE